MPASTAQLVRLANQYHIEQMSLADSNRRAIRLIWDRTVDDVSDEVMDRFATQAARNVLAHQSRAVGLADAYIRGFERLVVGRAPRALDVPEVVKSLRGGVTPLEVYQRPIVTARTALSQGKSFAEALRIGKQRAATTAHTDATLASHTGATKAMEKSSRIVGYRRMPDSGACPFCLLISTQTYRAGRNFESHANCNCSMIPIIGSADPGRVIDREKLSEVKDKGVTVYKKNAEGERVKYNYKRDDVAIRQHGELGPQITLAKHSFTGQSEI